MLFIFVDNTSDQLRPCDHTELLTNKDVTGQRQLDQTTGFDCCVITCVGLFVCCMNYMSWVCFVTKKAPYGANNASQKGEIPAT